MDDLLRYDVPPEPTGLRRALSVTVLGLMKFLVFLPWLSFKLCAHFYDLWSDVFSRLPGLSGVFMRRAWYEMTLRRCGRNLFVAPHALIGSPICEIGDNVYVGRGCVIGRARIGNDVMFADHVFVLSGGDTHPFTDPRIPARLAPTQKRTIAIGNDVWVGVNAVIMEDVADRCIVGASALVNAKFPPASVLVGLPARRVKGRFD